ncbi:hypothetical protein B0T24DRAFT_617661 [Lasiosphaeria ovina]|uniref:Uncharacterized protein n=1 Tax=Lasiosphaeria ovina TaxID=92902 RepID=A0AAE0KGT7_9PEZI|nr:hypothetical protein B0T24DRAFT_617661 [Lasiosphaeria ovina]
MAHTPGKRQKWESSSAVTLSSALLSLHLPPPQAHTHTYTHTCTIIIAKDLLNQCPVNTSLRRRIPPLFSLFIWLWVSANSTYSGRQLLFPPSGQSGLADMVGRLKALGMRHVWVLFGDPGRERTGRCRAIRVGDRKTGRDKGGWNGPKWHNPHW